MQYTNSNDFEQTNWFTVTHNVSSDQSPITVNRTNVTLYGVQPGKTYTVEIIFNLSTQCYSEYSAAYYIQGHVHVFIFNTHMRVYRMFVIN